MKIQNLLVELYKKQIWNDQKTVNVIAAACFSKTAKVLAVALQFFAGKDPEKGSDSESESDVIYPFIKKNKISASLNRQNKLLFKYLT